MSLSLPDWGGALVALPVPRENRRSVKLGGQDGETPRELCCLFFQLFDVSHQLIFFCQAAEVEADHFVGPLRGLAARP